MGNRLKHHHLPGCDLVAVGVTADSPVVLIDPGKGDPLRLRKGQTAVYLYIDDQVPGVVFRLDIFHRNLIQPVLGNLHFRIIGRIDCFGSLG